MCHEKIHKTEMGQELNEDWQGKTEENQGETYSTGI
jgi:hypothetical protein